MISLLLLGLLSLPFVIVGGAVALLWRKRRRSVLRWSGTLYLAAVILFFLGIGPYLVAWAIARAETRPLDRQLSDNPADYGLNYEDVVFESTDELRLAGWYVPPRGRNAVLICTHGLFRNRVELLGRVAPLCRAGYGALLYDSRSHGSSAKGIVSLGYYEKRDVLGAVDHVVRRYADRPASPRIVLMGVSMGAVATLEAAAESDRYSALILDSPFSSFSQTIVDHSWQLLRMPRFPFPTLVLFWYSRLAGFDPARVDTGSAIQRVKPVPLLLIASRGDRRISHRVAGSLYEKSVAPVKELKVFGEDVPHGASARLYPQEYSSLLLGFLANALKDDAVESVNRGTSAAADSPR